MPDQLDSCLLGNTYTYTRTVITRSVDGVTRHTRHRLTGCKDDRLPTFLILACDTIWETQTHHKGPRQITSHNLYSPPLPPLTAAVSQQKPCQPPGNTKKPGACCCATSRPQTGSRM